MKKLLAAFLLFLSLCALSACGVDIDMPSEFYVDPETLTLHWNAVADCEYYTVHISGQEQEIITKSNQLSLENLAVGEYEIHIRANGDGQHFQNSEWTVYHFTRQAESGLEYALIHNGTAYELVGPGSASGDVVMEDEYRGKPVVSIADSALYGNTDITGFVVGDHVKSIGMRAFTGCEALTSVTIAEGVTQIGRAAFQNCKKLRSVVLPQSVTEIAPYTFAWCESLETVTLGAFTSEIGAYAFSNCKSLQSIRCIGSETEEFQACLPDSVRFIRESAFSDCLSLEDMHIGAGVEILEAYAFSNCPGLERVALSDQLLSVGDYAFAKCTDLEQISLPSSVKTLGEGAFLMCEALHAVHFGDDLQKIGKEAFAETAIMANAEQMLVIDGWLIQILEDTVTTLVLPNSVYGIADYAAAGKTQLIQAEFSGIRYVGNGAFSHCDSLFLARFDDALLGIGDSAFYDCPYLSMVNLGGNIQTIGNYAFYDCTTLKEVELPTTVTSVGTRAFRNTAAFRSVEAGNGGVVYMGNWAVDFVPIKNPETSEKGNAVDIDAGTRGIANYTFCNKVISAVSLPNSLEYICKGAFCNSSIITISLPYSLKQIGDYAFYGCGSTNFGVIGNELDIPEGTTYIGRSAFYGCTGIVSVMIPGSVKVIGDYAFFGCKNLGGSIEVTGDSGEVDENGLPVQSTTVIEGSLTLNLGIETIGHRAFQNCNSLKKVIIPNSVTDLGSHAFYKCESLSYVVVGAGITEIRDYMFYQCALLQGVSVSGELKSIGNHAFSGCASLNEMNLRNVRYIGKYAFSGCVKMDELILSDTLSCIDDFAFRGCASLQSIVIPDSVTKIGQHAFYGMNRATIYCVANGIQPEWNAHFNSSFRPVFWNCVLSDDGSYVISISTGVNNMANIKAVNGAHGPNRNRYTFDGWATEPDSTVAAFTVDNILEAPEGIRLYAIWLS